MKTLIIIRHAKSDWHLNLPDFERPLNIRGLRDAPTMADRLEDRIGRLDALVHSTAVRTTQTAGYFIEELSVLNVIPTAEIYEANLEILIDCVTELNNDFDKVALVGHNPGVSYLVNYLTNNDVDMKTCAMACITFEVNSWAELKKHSGQLLWVETP